MMELRDGDLKMKRSKAYLGHSESAGLEVYLWVFEDSRSANGVPQLAPPQPP